MEDFISNGTFLLARCAMSLCFNCNVGVLMSPLALMIAVTHLLIFRFLDGKRTDGIPQTYVTTASNIMATLFGASLIAALAIAFTQYLWQLMRRTSMKVINIERLFTIRINPFLLFNPAVIRCAPVLFFCAVLIWCIHIATSFPPGALTVQLTKRTSFQMLPVPTFNSSEVWNFYFRRYALLALKWSRLLPPSPSEAAPVAISTSLHIIM